MNVDRVTKIRNLSRLRIIHLYIIISNNENKTVNFEEILWEKNLNVTLPVSVLLSSRPVPGNIMIIK